MIDQPYDSAGVRVSVVIPTFNRPDLLHRCLRALTQQTLPRNDYEILVCDDGAEKAPRSQHTSGAEGDFETQKEPRSKAAEVVDSTASEQSVAIKYLAVVGEHGPAAARNLGWRQARGSIIAFTDDDTIPAPTWLAEGLRAIQPRPASDNSICDSASPVAVTGRVIMPLPEKPRDYERDAAGLTTADFVTANVFVRRGALERIGGFDTRFTTAWREDSDLHFRLLPLGEIRRAPEAVVLHPIREAPWGVSLKQVRKSFFNALLYKKHRVLYRKKIQASPPLRYYAMVVLIIEAIFAAKTGRSFIFEFCFALWCALWADFVLTRLRGNSHHPSHVLEMAVTSALIPPLAVFWRIRGALQFRVLFL